MKNVAFFNFWPSERFRLSELRELWVSRCTGLMLRFEAIVARSGAASRGTNSPAAPDFYQHMYTFAMKNSRWSICAQRVGDM